MVRHVMTTVTSRPIEEAWAFFEDISFNLPRGGLTLGIRRTSPGPVGLGSTFKARVQIFGFESRYSGAVTEWDPPHTATVSLKDEGIIRSGSLRVTMEAIPQGTRIVRVSEVEPQGLMKLLWPIIGPLVRRRMDASNDKLWRLFEADRRERGTDVPS